MKRSKNSKRVSWAPGVSLCQVRLFLTEDCPSKVGGEAQDHVQAKASWTSQLNNVESTDLPPGFEHSLNMNRLEEASHIPLIAWKCPPMFGVNSNWRVAAGEKSQEKNTQKLREMRVLEAVYPRLSAIPSSPSISLEVQDEHMDDRLTPIVPLIPIEEAGEYVPSDLTASVDTPITPQPSGLAQDPSLSRIPNTSNCPVMTTKPQLGLLPDLGADLITAVSAAVSAFMKSEEQGSLIDTDLLVTIFSDPKMVEKLIVEYGAPANTVSETPFVPTPVTKVSETPSVSTPVTKPIPPLVPTPVTKPIPPTMRTPVTKPIPTSCPKSALMPANPNEHLNLGPNGGLPIPSSLTPIPDIVPLSSAEPIMVLAPTPASGKLYPNSNPMQRSSSVMPAQSTTIAVSPLTAPIPNAMPNLVHHISSTMPTKPVTSSPTVKATPVKDLNYIKNLIKEHGEEKKIIQERIMTPNGGYLNNFQNLESGHSINMRETKPKTQKSCLYFKSPKGCRNGFKCPYRHDMPIEWRTGSVLDAPSAKRLKLDGAITGRT